MSKATKFVVDCMQPIRDEIFEISDFHQYLIEHFKVGKNGKAGQLGDDVTIKMEKYSVIIVSKDAFAKRYLKYLAAKFLKKNDLRDYLRIVANAKNSYQLRYYSVDEETEEQE
ncbi:Ribosomal protein L22e [Carpediemonas membranifera]|uniref:Large ribosomal subunit protein eL22 n=1 Tax=Carpediemonas membranifera TaxID=201153 RepID=A0A8J6BYE0_9EUKA|nr:Ribosomal protein L22e [Carpediemonas membranifera]KAG9394710.1 Ribosomal protein L22e [Carpediemonas membranifera]|eukprot:KAG9394386.1 Ribosomal protein L22e [Carpediemonas membranifera]